MKKHKHYIKDAFRTAWFFRIICSCGEQFIGFTAKQAQWAYREHIQKVYGLLSRGFMKKSEGYQVKKEFIKELTELLRKYKAGIYFIANNDRLTGEKLIAKIRKDGIKLDIILNEGTYIDYKEL